MKRTSWGTSHRLSHPFTPVLWLGCVTALVVCWTAYVVTRGFELLKGGR